MSSIKKVDMNVIMETRGCILRSVGNLVLKLC